RSAVVSQGTEHRIRVDRVAGAGQEAVAVVAAEVVAERDERAVRIRHEVRRTALAGDDRVAKLDDGFPYPCTLKAAEELWASPAIAAGGVVGNRAVEQDDRGTGTRFINIRYAACFLG